MGEAIRYDRPVPRFKSSSIKRKDELGDVIGAFQEMVDKVYQAMGDRKKAEHRLERVVRQLENASQKIQTLNHRLESENFRLSAELDITRRLQRMLLPKDYELNQLQDLDVAGFMEPADDVGGDYYDVLQHNGSIKIGIGDVTGHGLESGVLMIMTQTAVRTLLASDETDPVKFLNTLNRAIYGNLQRMDSEKSLTLSLLDYQDGVMSISGQHEEVLLVRATGKIERIDTIDLGFPIGLEAEISQFVEQIQVALEPGDGIVLYTDGITEAENWRGDHYGLGRLCHVVQHEWYHSAADIQNSVIQDVQQFIGTHDIYDDITLLVVKRK
ncbi:MAG: PP2C family protein-serine/threonine phosphatase [Elainellaceae cyanobacterium]